MATPQQAQSLKTLLKMQPQVPRYDEFEDLIPEEDLYGEQQAAADEGYASGGAYSYTPSRESLRRSGGTRLRSKFAEMLARAEGAALPERIKGEYGVRGAEITGRAAVEAARFEAERAAQSRAETFEHQRGLAGQAQGARRGQAEAGWEASAERQGAAERGRAIRQSAGAAQRRVGALRAGGKITIPPASGMWESLQRMLGMGKFDPETVRQQQIDEAQSGALSAIEDTAGELDGGPSAQEIAAQAAQDYPGQTLQQLMNSGAITVGSQDELDALIEAFGGL